MTSTPINIPALLGTSAWLGECNGEKISSLFNQGLVVNNPGLAENGDIVAVGKSVSVVAPADHAFNKVLRLLAKNGMDPQHSNEVLAEAERFDEVAMLEDNGLEDLQHLPFVTIDNEDSRDLDQALYLEKNQDSGYQVYYALADAAWFVTPGSSLHRNAMARGVTFYAPSLAVTMLPPVLSENLVSLNPQVTRRALVFQLELDTEGLLLKTTVFRAKIRSQAKLSYDGVQAYLDVADSSHDYSSEPWSESLATLKTVGELRMQDAVRRDVINFNRLEANVVIDAADPTRFTVAVRERNLVEQYNEQISLLCNTAGAALLEQLERHRPELQAVYRVHLPPLKQRISTFRKKLRSLVEARALNEQWHWNHQTSLADYIEGLPQSHSTARTRQAVERLVMMTNRASSYSEEAEVHHALGVDAYARFSSPMREMVGIFTHKELLEALLLEPPADNTADQALRDNIITLANDTKKRQSALEKECQLLAIESFLQADLTTDASLRPQRKATVMGMAGNKIYLTLDSFALDIKLYKEDIEAQFDAGYEISEVIAQPLYKSASQKTAPTLIVGDEVSIVTREWHTERRRFTFKLHQ